MSGTILYIWLLLFLLVGVGVGSTAYFLRAAGKNSSSRKYVPLLGLLAALCLAIGIVTAKYPSRMKDTFVSSSIDIMEKNQESTAAYINEEMNLNKSQLRMIAGMLEDRLGEDLDRKQIAGLMKQMEEEAGFDNIGLLPLDSPYPFALTSDAQPVSVRVSLVNDVAFDNSVDVSYGTSAFLSDTAGRDTVLFRTYFKDANDSQYLLIAEKPVSVLDSILNRSVNAEPGEASVLCRRNGNIVYGGGEIDGSSLVSYNLFSYLSKKGINAEIVDQLKLELEQSGSGNVQMSIGEQNYFLVYRDVEDTDWVIVSLYSETYLAGSNLAVVNSRTMHLVLIVVIMLLLAMVLAIVAANLILKQKSERMVMEKEHLFEEMSRCIPSAFVILKQGSEEPNFISGNLNKVLNCDPPAWNMGGLSQWLGITITDQDIEEFKKTGAMRLVTQKNEAYYAVGFYDIGVIENCGYSVIVLEDITQQVNSRNLLEDSMARADSASQSKSAFLSKMSHEIRTPLNAVLGFSRLALDDWDKLSKEELHEYMEKIQTSGDYLLDLVSDVLDISRIEEGRMTVHTHPVNLDELIDEVSSSFNGQMKRKNIQFVVDKENTDVVLKMDPVHVRQILNNLLSNACKYTPENGCVGLEVHAKQLDASSMSVQFIVQDTGIGMSKEFCEKIFDPFTQDEAGMRMKNQMRGSGLGMSICRNLVQMLNGTIQVESTIGEGSTFTVQFNFQKDEQTDKAVVKSAAPEDYTFLKGRRVLVVDDVEMNRQIMQKILQRYGMIVEMAENGQIAVEQFENKMEPYYCIFMDIQMPIMNGYEAVQAIRSSGAADAKTAVISAMSADAFSEDINKALMSGMNYHITKPVKIERILEVLSSIEQKGEQA